ncbi:MAG: hypothetical protein EKK53_19940 [Burkholderiales bacterium]|nr:MAG: hypothetical protein EKK53_19940 [Burkholderiales bacterium]
MARRWVAGLLGLGLVGVLGWQGLRPASGPGESVQPGKQLAPAVAAPSAPDGRPGPGSRAAIAPAAASASAAAAGLAGLHIPPEGLEICGIGRMSAEEIRRLLQDPDADSRWERKQAALIQRGDAALARMALRLSSGSDRQQVAARLLMGDVDGAALLAAPSADPVAYQLALTACSPWISGGPVARCSQLSAQRWAQLDPADARPWIHMLDAARQRGDPAEIDTLMAEVAARTKLSRGAWLLVSEVASVIETETDDAARGHANVKVIGLDAAMVHIGLLSVMKACDSADPAHARRAPHCRAAATQLLAASSDLLEALQAQKLADRLGVPKSAQAHDAATLKAAGEALNERTSAVVGLDCASMVSWTRFSRERGEMGELAQALSLVERRPPR